MEMTPDRWRYTEQYSNEVFGTQDDHLDGLMDRAVAAGLPSIAVSADVGRLLTILTKLTPGHRALELGTLAGYSAIWIARGLAPKGHLTTIEYEPRHAEFANAEFETAGVGDQIDVVIGAALDVLPGLTEDWGLGSIDLAFVDAVKTEYPDYFEMIKPMMASGGLLVADNVYGTGAGWIDEGHGTDRFNRTVAADPDFEAVALPIRQGVLVARRR